MVGSNGVGKSTLAKQLCGLIAANTSLVTSWGNNGRTRNAASFYVMQEAANQIFFESVEEELLQGRRDKRSCERAAYLLKKIDLWEQRLEHPQMLSGGRATALGSGGSADGAS
ncbi:MAG: ATP-binding cassette domain-containing protein [Atopobium sp.]|uniref:ATP-binding cassette domain-containing protein n=1 Tax=Atopobium sp. TaxID=1872650 RepID=UPI002A815CCE|nr:ATP-binding cassette domain-containing protein [Atopobium sp.]MDY4523063.1 ATP-binding cassette domain-containing protein [Atopobium sp.]